MSKRNVAEFVSGRKTVAVVGTQERLVAAATAARTIVITAETDNTGIITVGDQDVEGALATREGTPLAAGDSMSIEIGGGTTLLNLRDIWLDTTVAGDGVTFNYWQ